MGPEMYYLLQALQQRYVTVPVKSIQYFDGKALADTSAAIGERRVQAPAGPYRIRERTCDVVYLSLPTSGASR